MSSPFFGLDVWRLRLCARSATARTRRPTNVANANTPGYSRQRVRAGESPPYTFPAFNRTGLPGQIGSGVTVASISRYGTPSWTCRLRRSCL